MPSDVALSGKQAKQIVGQARRAARARRPRCAAGGVGVAVDARSRTPAAGRPRMPVPAIASRRLNKESDNGATTDPGANHRPCRRLDLSQRRDRRIIRRLRMAMQASAVRARLVALAGLAALAAIAAPIRAQLPLAVAKSSGQTVTPAFEGWYRNPDGTFSISFGYYNRNAEEVVERADRRRQLRRAGTAESGTADRVPAAAPLGRLRREGAGRFRRRRK